MYRSFLHGLLFLSYFTTAAQTQTSSSFLKAYNYVQLFGQIEYLGVENTSDLRLTSLSSLGFAWSLEKENGLYHELEIARFLFSIEDNGTSLVETTSGSFRYEFGALMPHRNKRIKVRMGGAARYYLANRNIIVFESILQTTHGLILSITPHLDWQLYKRFYFELAPTFQVLNGSMRLEENYQQTLTIEEETAVDFYFQAFRPLLRFGISYRL